MRADRRRVELLLVLVLTVAVFGAAELYAGLRGVEQPEGRRAHATRASVFAPGTVHLSYQERFWVRSGRMAPVYGGVGILAAVWRRRRPSDRSR